MKKILIRESEEYEKALIIAKQLPDFFSKKGLVSLGRDLKNQKVYGAFINKDLVAFISFRKADKASLEITWLAVLPNYQGIGVGSRLLKESLNLLAGKRYEICYVKTLAETVFDIGYEKTRNFYKKLGFYTLEIISPYPGWDKENPCQILAASLPLK